MSDQLLKTLEDLSPFTRGYVEAIFFTDEEDLSDEGMEGAGFSDLAPETLKKLVEDCAGFSMLHKGLLEQAYAVVQERPANWVNPLTYDARLAGHDFWLTRNGHGAGFWDRGLGEVGDKLAALVGHGTRWPALSTYVGDDLMIHFE